MTSTENLPVDKEFGLANPIFMNWPLVVFVLPLIIDS
jgi:hypothetical protein